jgi:hypothetical protein
MLWLSVLTLSMALVEYVTIWLDFGGGVFGKSKGKNAAGLLGWVRTSAAWVTRAALLNWVFSTSVVPFAV